MYNYAIVLDKFIFTIKKQIPRNINFDWTIHAGNGKISLRFQKQGDFSMSKQYKLTTISCFTGIFVQAIIVNLTPVLFVPFMAMYNFSYIHLGILVGVNFSTQVFADIAFSGFIDKIGFKRLVTTTCAVAFAGLLLFGLTPNIFEDKFLGFIISTVIFSLASGLLEVVLSPITDAIPNDDKGPAMSLMHSFYAWGQVATIIVTTLALFLFGNGCWQYIVFFWTLIPLVCFFMFLKAKMPPNAEPDGHSDIKKLLLNPIYLLALVAIMFGGATEVCMNQWSSAFLNDGLGIPKLTGDLLGMCGFSVMLGLGRVLYGVFGARINLSKILIWGSAVCVVCYAAVALSPINGLNILLCALTGLFASILWPGVLVISSERFPHAGSWMFAILAAAGDIGAAAAPYITGVISDYATDASLTATVMNLYGISAQSAAMRLAILASLIFPLVTTVCHILIYKKKNLKQV